MKLDQLREVVELILTEYGKIKPDLPWTKEGAPKHATANYTIFLAENLTQPKEITDVVTKRRADAARDLAQHIKNEAGNKKILGLEDEFFVETIVPMPTHSPEGSKVVGAVAVHIDATYWEVDE